MKLLNEIQQKLKCDKSQTNKFGGYKYRSCEDILEAVKPFLGDAILTSQDELVLVGDRYYIKATITLTDGDKSCNSTAYAREAQIQKGMSESQITLSASSYARKSALNGLFCIDDTKETEGGNSVDLPDGELSKEQEEFLNMVCNTLELPEGFLVNKANVKAAIITACKGETFPTETARVANTVKMLMAKYVKTIFEKDETPY